MKHKSQSSITIVQIYIKNIIKIKTIPSTEFSRFMDLYFILTFKISGILWKQSMYLMDMDKSEKRQEKDYCLR